MTITLDDLDRQGRLDSFLREATKLFWSRFQRLSDWAIANAVKDVSVLDEGRFRKIVLEADPTVEERLNRFFAEVRNLAAQPKYADLDLQFSTDDRPHVGPGMPIGPYAVEVLNGVEVPADWGNKYPKFFMGTEPINERIANGLAASIRKDRDQFESLKDLSDPDFEAKLAAWIHVIKNAQKIDEELLLNTLEEHLNLTVSETTEVFVYLHRRGQLQRPTEAGAIPAPANHEPQIANGPDHTELVGDNHMTQEDLDPEEVVPAAPASLEPIVSEAQLQPVAVVPEAADSPVELAPVAQTATEPDEETKLRLLEDQALVFSDAIVLHEIRIPAAWEKRYPKLVQNGINVPPTEKLASLIGEYLRGNRDSFTSLRLPSKALQETVSAHPDTVRRVVNAWSERTRELKALSDEYFRISLKHRVGLTDEEIGDSENPKPDTVFYKMKSNFNNALQFASTAKPTPVVATLPAGSAENPEAPVTVVHTEPVQPMTAAASMEATHEPEPARSGSPMFTAAPSPKTRWWQRQPRLRKPDAGYVGKKHPWGRRIRRLLTAAVLTLLAILLYQNRDSVWNNAVPVLTNPNMMISLVLILLVLLVAAMVEGRGGLAGLAALAMVALAMIYGTYYLFFSGRPGIVAPTSVRQSAPAVPSSALSPEEAEHLKSQLAEKDKELTAARAELLKLATTQPAATIPAPTAATTVAQPPAAAVSGRTTVRRSPVQTTSGITVLRGSRGTPYRVNGRYYVAPPTNQR